MTINEIYQTIPQGRQIILTGDRPTGPLHLGHYIGSLKNRIILQELHTQYVMIADIQALTDHYDRPEKVRDSVVEVMLDYLAVGIDPHRTTIFLQSAIPEIAELTILYLNLVTINRLRRNPTVKTEIHQKGFGENVNAGFLMYPIHQAADITVVKATLVPVGEDQLPMIEQTNEIVRDFNRIYHRAIFPEVRPLVPAMARLPGIDGSAKMGKSLGNAIYLSDSPDDIARKVRSMYTDPGHVHVNDPGKVEGNVVFTYLDLFDKNIHEVAALKEHYRHGGLGDMVLKKRLTDVLEDFIGPIRTRRLEYAQNLTAIVDIMRKGSERVRTIAQQTMHEVREAIGITYW
jgi:tryptophanyl-tRNA synthetase